MERTMNGESVYPGASPELTLDGQQLSVHRSASWISFAKSPAATPSREIANRLNMSVATVKTHILNMLEKTASATAPSWPIRARESGLVILNRRN